MVHYVQASNSQWSSDRRDSLLSFGHPPKVEHAVLALYSPGVINELVNSASHINTSPQKIKIEHSKGKNTCGYKFTKKGIYTSNSK
jgi:hypothetical protein